MLAELRAESEYIEQAIMVLQRMAAGHGKRRGRPPAWMSAGVAMVKRRGRLPEARTNQRTPPPVDCRHLQPAKARVNAKKSCAQRTGTSGVFTQPDPVRRGMSSVVESGDALSARYRVVRCVPSDQWR